MYITLFILSFIAILIYFVFTKPLKVFFVFDSNREDMFAHADWLPLLKTEVKIVQMKVFIDVYFFRWRILSKFLKKGKQADKNLLKTLQLRNTCIRMYYGLDQPQYTGILYGAMGLILSTLPVDTLEQFPEFFPQNEYLRVEARTDLYMGSTLVNLIKAKFKERQRRKKYGAIQYH